MKHTLYRFVLLLTALALIFFALPQPVHAAAMSLDIVSVKADTSVTVRANGFPANQSFTVRMDVAGNAAVNGIVVATTDSKSGGIFEATYNIPAELKGKSTIAIRMDSAAGGYYVYNWFNNKSTSSTTVTPTTPTTAVVGPYVSVVAVTKNQKATVAVKGFPANTDFKVRVGPFYTFSSNNEVVTTFNSGKGGAFEFNITLPALIKDLDLVAIRLDSTSGSTHYFAYNAFHNANLEKTTTTTGSTTVITNACSVTSVLPVKSMTTRYDFDAVFTVKNTGNTNWDMHVVDVKFLSGTKMQTHGDTFDLAKTVKPGESITITIDMLAPDNAGTYVSNWGLVNGSTRLCTMSLGVVVR